MKTYTFPTKAKAMNKFNDLYLNEPSKFFNLYFNKIQKTYILREELKSNG